MAHLPFIDPCWDPVFKSIFTKDTPSSKAALRGLLSAILDQKLEAVTITANEPPSSRRADRQIRYDINCVLNNGERVNVEMTLYPNAYDKLKMEYYLGRLFTGQDIRGKNISYGKLKQSYQISLLANRRLFKDRHFYHRFIYYDPERAVKFGGRTAIITLELKKLAEIALKPVREMSRKERWGLFFAYYTDPDKQELIQEIVEMEEEIRMAEAVIHEFTEQEIAFFHEISKEKYEFDLASHRHEARDLGYAEGRNWGIAEGETRGYERARLEYEGKLERAGQEKLEIARKMKARGRPLEEIAGDTGLPVQTIAKL